MGDDSFSVPFRLIDPHLPVGSPADLPASPPQRIVVVKWDRLVADAIMTVVRAVCPAAEVRLCHTAAEARRTLRERPVEIGLVGMSLPDEDGLDLLSEILRERWIAKIVAVSGRRDEHTLHCLHRARLAGYFDYAIGSGTELREAIRTIVGGNSWFGHGRPAPATVVRPGRPRLHELLTPAELQVFAVLGDGTPDPAAAARLGVSKNTLRTHCTAVMRKLDLHTRMELMNAARHTGVVRFTPDGVPLYPGLKRDFVERGAKVEARRKKRAVA